MIDPGYQIPDTGSVAAVQCNIFFIRHLASSIRYLLEPGSYFRSAVLVGVCRMPLVPVDFSCNAETKLLVLLSQIMLSMPILRVKSGKKCNRAAKNGIQTTVEKHKQSACVNIAVYYQMIEFVAQFLIIYTFDNQNRTVQTEQHCREG